MLTTNRIDRPAPHDDARLDVRGHRLFLALILVFGLALGACAESDGSGPGDEDVAVTSATETDAVPETDAVGETDAVEDGAVEEGLTDDDGEAATADEDAASDDSAATDPRFPLTGTLELVGVEGGCLVLRVGDTQYEVLADPGAELAVDTANGVVADASGTELAAVGDEVTVEGSIDTGVATFCQVGPPLFVTAVSPA